MNTRFVICSRANSRRIPRKPFVKINGKPLIEHLLDRLVKIISPVYVAVPPADSSDYIYLQEKYDHKVEIFCDEADDPLARMFECAKSQKIDHVIRVSHDKIFIDPTDVFDALNAYMERGLDYLYSSTMTDGTAFEIMSKDLLSRATKEFKNVEHISYAAKAMTKNSMDFDFSHKLRPFRLLIDFPEDLTLMNTIFACLGNDCTRSQVYSFFEREPWLMQINDLPVVSVYTCAFNNQATILDTINSVKKQKAPFKFEYILVDDFSTDQTPLLMSKAASDEDWITYIRNGENIGLASSSNLALSHARGKYIVRLDADDYFSEAWSLVELATEIQMRSLDVVYPGFYDGQRGVIGDPSEKHHPAGAIFRTRALNHVKFTDKLRHYDGLDLYLRAKEQLNIGYLKKPIFFYRHRPESLSRNPANQEEREEVETRIMKNEQICTH